MNLITFTSRAAAALVAAVAGFSSYRHIYDVALGAGEHHAVALALPLSIDGLIVVGTMALLEDKRAGRLPRQSARFALGFGVLATLAANVASAEPTATARMVAAVPAISFLIAVEVLARTGRPRDNATPTEAPEMPARASVPVVTTDAPVSSPARQRKRTVARQGAADRVARLVDKTPGITQPDVARRLGLSLRTVSRHWPRPADETPTGPPDRVNGHVPASREREEVPA